MENLFVQILLTYLIIVLIAGLVLIGWYSIEPKNKKKKNKRKELKNDWNTI